MKPKKKTDSYVYPALFVYQEGKEIAVVFPDFDVATSGVDEKDALQSARELLAITIMGLEEDEEVLPVPTEFNKLSVGDNQKSVLIDVFMPTYRLAYDTKAVSRTITLPAWLNAAALEKNVNFSALLQSALKEQLNLEERI